MHTQDIVHLTSGQAKYGFPQMSVKALTWAFDQPIAGNGKVVLLALADHANERGICWPSISLLMQRAHVGERTVQRVIQSLEDAGFITRERRQRENGGDTSNLYRLMLDKVSQGVSACASVDQRGSGGVNLAPPPVEEGVTQTGGEGVTGTGGEGVTQTAPIRTVIKNRQIEPPNILYDAAFEEFWAAYPKRPGNPKKSAKLKYVNARKRNISHQTIMAGVNAYAKSRKGEDPKYTKLAETWLNKECWEVDYPDASPSAADAATVGDEDLDAVVNQYKGIVSDRMAAKRILASEISTGTPLDRIVEAAEKYAMHRKQMRYDGIEITAPILETWLKFKWREMDAYFISKSPMRKPILRPVSEKRK
jgi:hypothetical protein